jgi:hypothetical protein
VFLCETPPVERSNRDARAPTRGRVDAQMNIWTHLVAFFAFFSWFELLYGERSEFPLRIHPQLPRSLSCTRAEVAGFVSQSTPGDRAILALLVASAEICFCCRCRMRDCGPLLTKWMIFRARATQRDLSHVSVHD